MQSVAIPSYRPVEIVVISSHCKHQQHPSISITVSSQRGHSNCSALLLSGPAQVASKQLLKAKLYYWSIIASASPAPPAPRRALPVANRLRACPPAQRPQQPPRAVTAAQSTIWTPAAAARAHGLPSQVSKFLRQGQDVCRRGTRDACHWHPLLSSLPTSWATTSRNWDAAHLPQGVAAPAPLVSKLSV